MKLESVCEVIQALNRARVRYLVAGGLAVAAHGYLRFTNDVDIVIELEPGNIFWAFTALEELGYRPLAPITARRFADIASRDCWVSKMDMKVLSFWSNQHPETPIDVIVEVPFDFDKEYREAAKIQLFGWLEIIVVSLSTLIRIKEAADRPKDRIDVEYLSLMLKEGKRMNILHDTQVFDWSMTTWEGNRLEQMRRWSELALEDTIRTLEGMEILMKHLSQGRLEE